MVPYQTLRAENWWTQLLVRFRIFFEFTKSGNHLNGVQNSRDVLFWRKKKAPARKPANSRPEWGSTSRWSIHQNSIQVFVKQCLFPIVNKKFNESGKLKLWPDSPLRTPNFCDFAFCQKLIFYTHTHNSPHRHYKKSANAADKCLLMVMGIEFLGR